MSNGGPLSFEATLNNQQFNAQLTAMESRTGSFTTNLINESQKWDSTFNKLGVAIGAAFTFQKAESFISDVIKVRGEFQQLDIAFTSMLQSKSKADTLMAQIVQTAQTTPFNLTDVAQGAKQLLAYGTGADNVNDTLIRLGNVASGLSVPLNDLVYLYGTLQSQGRAYATDIRQFAGRGIPIYEELAKVLGVSKDKVNDLVEAGKVGFPQIQKVFENLTNKGGMFYNLMEQQSKSLSGQVSNLGDAWDQMLNKIGASNEGALSGGISLAADLVQHYEEIGKILAVLIATYGSYKAAMIAVSTVQSIIASSTVASVYLEMAAGLGKVTAAEYANALAIGIQAKAQAALNIALAASPYLFVAAAVGTLTAAYFVWKDSADVAGNAQKAVNDEMERSAKLNQDLKSQVANLTGIINDSNATTFEQVSAFAELQRILPQVYGSLTLQTAKTLSAADAQKKLNQVIDENNIQNLSKAYEDQKSKLNDLLSEYTTLGKAKTEISDIDQNSPKYLLTQKVILDDLGEKIKEQKRLKEQAAEQDKIDALPLQKKIDYYQQIENELSIQIDTINQSQKATGGVANAVDILTGKVHQTAGAFNSVQGFIDSISLDGLQQRLNEVQKTLLGLTGKDKTVKNYSYYETAQKDAQETYRNNLPGTEAYKKAKVDYDAATDALKQWDLTNKKVKKPKKEDIVLPAGSVGEYDRLIQKANEALTKTPVDQTQRVKDLQKTILDLTKKRAEAQKVIEVRTWQETLDFKKKQYEQYESIIDAANGGITDQISLLAAEHAPEYFKDLLAGGKSYLDFLQNQLDPIQTKVFNGTATDNDVAKFVQLKAQIAELTGTTSPFQQYTEGLDKMKRDAGSTAEYLSSLKDALAQLNTVPDNQKTITQLNEEKELRNRIKETVIAQGEALKTFLQQVKGSEDQRLAITKKYAALKAEAEKEGKPTVAIDKAEIDELAENAQEANAAWKKLNNTIYDTSTRNGLVKLVADTKAYYDSIKDNATYTAKQIQEAKANAESANKELSDFDERNWLTLADAIGSIGNDLAGMEGVLGSIGSLLAGAAGQANTFAANLKLAKANADAVKGGGSIDTSSTVASAVQGIASLTNILLNSIEKKKADKNSRELDAINFQVELNKALNEELRLRSQLAENVYFEDYAGRIQDSIGAATDALTKYNLALANLADNGKSLTGTKNVIDWGNVGKGALSGLGTGAVIGGAIGTVVGPVGTVIGAAVGAVVGGVIGLFSTKVKNLYGPLLAQYPQLIDANGELNKTLAETLISTNQVDDKTKLWLQDLINAADAMEAAKKQIDDIVSQLSGDLGNDLRDALVTAFEDGTDAATAFSKSVEKTLNNVLSNLIFSAVFKNVFDNLQKQLEDGLLIYGTTGQLGNVMDAFDQFIKDSKGDVDLFNQLLKAAQDKGALSGLNLFSPDDNSPNASAAQGISRSITEDTASLISGQINAMRVNQAAALSVFKTHTNQFEMMLHYQSYLVRIDQKLAAQAQTPWRALGLGEDPEH